MEEEADVHYENIGTDNTSNVQEQETHIRQSTREKRKPRWTSDFICQVNFTAHENNLSKIVNVDYTCNTRDFCVF